MIELFNKKRSIRSSKPNPLVSLMRGTSKREEKKAPFHNSIPSSNVAGRANDPYMPRVENSSHTTLSTSLSRRKHAHRTCKDNSSPAKPRRVHNSQSQSKHTCHHQHHCYSTIIDTNPMYTTPHIHNSSLISLQQCSQLYMPPLATPPLSPTSFNGPAPPLSPTKTSFYTTIASPRTRREVRHNPKYRITASVSSSESETTEEENIDVSHMPIHQRATVIKRNDVISLDDEEDDDDLIPIAKLSLGQTGMSAAEKYKVKIRARLQMDKLSPSTT